MIIANLKGGLGNQLFQIAAGYALAKRVGTDFAINYDFNHNCIQGFKPTKYKDNLYKNIPATNHVPRHVYAEPHFHYSEIPHHDDVVIDGYFQSLKYFENCIEDILNLFEFPETCYKKQERVKSIVGEDAVGVHIRRGDYKKYSNIHHLQPREYYETAIDALQCKYLLVATDDWQTFYEEQLLKKYEDSHTILSTGGCTEIDDLFLLSQCSSVVISNSTLAWWGAFLGKQNKKVFAPAKWFGQDGPQDYHDIFCTNWNII